VKPHAEPEHAVFGRGDGKRLYFIERHYWIRYGASVRGVLTPGFIWPGRIDDDYRILTHRGLQLPDPGYLLSDAHLANGIF
jgi:hypothetical protein